MGWGRLAIIGAGPAGLTAALAARQLGLDVRLYEQAADFRPIGGGILIHSNGLRVLSALGLVESFGNQMRATQQMNLELPNGRVLSQFDYRRLSVPFNYGAVVLRYQLQEHLLAAVRRAGIEPQFGYQCQGARFEQSGTILQFNNGVEIETDLVIAADGIHSQIRAASGLPAELQPIGEAYLRGVAELELQESTIREIWGEDGRRFGICPLPNKQTYFFCSVPLGQWSQLRDGGGFNQWLESWREFGETAYAIVRAVSNWQTVNYSELYQVKLPQWWRLPVFLIGDAAHAMTPNFGQGANSAMVDALVLVKLLAEARNADQTELAAVGARYDSIRRSFVSEIQKAAYQTGQMASWRAWPARWLRNQLIAVVGGQERLMRRQQYLLSGYNPIEEEFFRGA